MRRRARSQAGMTLMEVLIAVTLLAVLSVGMLMAMRVGLGALGKTNLRLMNNRRTTGTQKVLEQELQGLIPVSAQCGAGMQSTGTKIRFFQGERHVMRFVSGYSLQNAWRGMPQILEFFVIPTEDGMGVRLVVNESPYTGPYSAGRTCGGMEPDPVTQIVGPKFFPVQAGPQSFVLADRLAYCRFSFLEKGTEPKLNKWVERWTKPIWPMAIRVDMAGLGEDLVRIQPITITAPLHFYRSPEIEYVDF